MLTTLMSSTIGPERAGADAQHLDGADLGLLDGLLLAAELGGGIHLDREPAVGGGGELLAEALGRRDGRIAGRLHVGGLEHGF